MLGGAVDLFGSLKAMESVARVSNLDPTNTTLSNAIFFICPRMTGKGLRVNRPGTGLQAQYASGLSASAVDHIRRVERFRCEAKEANIEVNVTAIFAAADAWLLFPIPANVPAMPDEMELKAVSNFGAVKANFELFGDLYREAPWLSTPERVRRAEVARLSAMLPSPWQPEVSDEFVRGRQPNNPAEDFIARVFAGFALDGVLISQGLFGDNPIILGVESPGVATLQNAALAREDWLPIVQLR